MGRDTVAFLRACGHRPRSRPAGDRGVSRGGDPLAPAEAIVVIGGHTPFRAVEAAELYHQGWAPRVVLFRSYLWPEDRMLRELGVSVPQEWEVNRQVLLRLNVPDRAIQVLDDAPRNTDEEIRAIAHAFHGRSRPLIVITSKAHSRRFKATWEKSVKEASPRLIVRPSRSDSFDPSQWWKDRRWALSVVHEYLGLFHLWFGAPVSYRVE